MNNKSISRSKRLPLTSLNFLLAALLAVQLVFVWFSFRADQEGMQPVVSFFNTLQSGKTDNLAISESDGISLIFSQDNDGKWQIEQSDTSPVPADHLAVTKLLDKLTNLQSERLVALTESSHIRLKVDKTVFSKKITMRDNSGNEQVLFVGSSPDRQTSYVRSGESKKVYQVKGITSWELDTDIAAWLQE